MERGEQIDSHMVLDSRIFTTESNEEQEIFNSGIVNVDWSQYNFARSYVEMVGNTETRVIDLGGAAVSAIYVKTNVPVTLEYEQDNETRRFTVSPSVHPTDYFTSDRTPSDRPISYQPGIFLANGSPITSLTVKGIAGVKVAASVLIALAGYR